MTESGTVFVVDDDKSILDSLQLLLSAAGFRVEAYCNPQEFLKAYQPQCHGCLLLDIQMPEMSGLELQKILSSIGTTLPIIFISGRGDIPMAVQAMKAGAYEFIQKPFQHDYLLRCINAALAQDQRNREDQQKKQNIQSRIERLTPREREVMEYIVDGKATKVIAMELDLSPRTVEIYRSNLMHKLQTRSVAQLVKLVTEARA